MNNNTRDEQRTPNVIFYNAYGLDLAPDSARLLTFKKVCEQVPDIQIISDFGDWLYAAKGNDYSVLLYFNKPCGLFEVIVNHKTTSRFLGLGMHQPEKVWSNLGYHIQEDLGQKVTWSNGDAKIVAYYGNSEILNEIHYVIPEKVDTDSENTAWRELGFFNGGRGIIESTMIISGICFAEEDAVDNIIRFIKHEWKGDVPAGFWLVKSEADDANIRCPNCLGFDFKYKSVMDLIRIELDKTKSYPKCESKLFSLTPNDLFMQTQIETIHIKGLLKT
jgi:hypothetical protein